MVVLAQPSAYAAWDPLLQRFVSAPPAPLLASKPAERADKIATPGAPPSLAVEMAQTHEPTVQQEHAQPATPAAPGHATPQAPPTPAELEASSLAL
eukprot:355610-Prymnesium_polylepis.1